jgi:hypothetical protein
MYIYKFLLRMTDTMTSQNTDLSSWDTLYIVITVPEKVNANLMPIPYIFDVVVKAYF